MCVSYHSHWKIFEHFTGSFDVFLDAFLNDVAGYYTPFFKNVISFWELQKTADNVMFIFYEDMKRDLPSVIRKVSKFLGKPVAEKDMDALCTHLSFDKMKNNAAVNKQEWVDVSQLPKITLKFKNNQV